MKAEFTSSNPDLLSYDTGVLRFEILGGIKLTQLDQLRSTLKITKHKSLKRALRLTMNLYSNQEKNIQKIADLFDLEQEDVEIVLSDLTDELENYRLDKLDYLNGSKKIDKELTGDEISEAKSILRDKNLVDTIQSSFDELGIVGEQSNRLILFIAYTSRLQENPLHVICKGSSSGGKTSLITGVSKIIPEEHKIELTSMSKNSLFFSDSKELNHKLLLIEDLDSCDFQALLSLRELMSRQRLTKQIVSANNGTGDLKVKTLTLEAKVSTVAATTKNVYKDNANRSLQLIVSDSDEQTKKIHNYQQRIYAGEVDKKGQKKLIEKLQNVQRVLKPLEVRNPFAKELKLPENIDSPRRAMALYLQFINAVTFLFQYQRKLVKEKGMQYIESTKEDVLLANKLLREVLIYRTDDLTPPTRKAFEKMKIYLKSSGRSSFKTREIKEHLKIKSTSLKNYLKELEDNYLVQISSGSKTKGYAYSIVEEDYSKIENDVDKLLQWS